MGKAENSVQNLLPPREAAYILGISYPTLKQWIYHGKIKSVKTPGGHHRVPESEIDRLIPMKFERGDPAARRPYFRRISGRNQLIGRVVGLKFSGLLAQVTLAIGEQHITALITADVAYPRKLEAQGFVEPGTLRDYALGRIVIWMPNDSSVDLAKEGWHALLDRAVRKIAIANPELAPYGRAAASALKKAGIYNQVEAKLVYGENISQAAQFVQSGNAQAGIIALSLAFSPGMKDGKVWKIPPEMHPRIEQGAALLKNARNRSAALPFLNFVKSGSGINMLE